LTQFIIVVGDSFASDPDGWPGQLADRLGVQLVSYGGAGQHWWSVKEFLKTVSEFVIDNTVAIVVVHTFFDRIPSKNPDIAKLDVFDADDTSEMTTAVRLHYKYINNSDFMKWAQEKWFEELTEKWQHNKLINLHSFPWSLENKTVLPGGINVMPNLTSISLNETGANSIDLFNDIRPNHFDNHNNKELAAQLESIITTYTPGTTALDLSKFNQKTRKWDNWK
jgi:hypothetical protein